MMDRTDMFMMGVEATPHYGPPILLQMSLKFPHHYIDKDDQMIPW